MKNVGQIILVNNGGNGTGSFSVILSLRAGDEVYLEGAHWVTGGARYSHVSSFSGVLLHPDI